MSCSDRALIIAACCLLPFTAAADAGDWVIGAGIQSDSEDGIALSLLGDLSVGEDTWLSASVSRSTVEVPRRADSETWYLDLGIDHYFDPAGVRLGVAYWGDEDLLDSRDVRASVYTRSDDGFLSFDGEYRDFEFELPAFGQFPGVQLPFSATGLGLSGQIKAGDRVYLRAAGVSYEYDVTFNVQQTDRLVDILTSSRLSVLSSLADWRASAGIGIDFGPRRLQLDLSKWRGAIDGGDNVGATLSFMGPLSDRSDIEFSLGYDDSELFGDVTVLSLFVYFYGAD